MATKEQGTAAVKEYMAAVAESPGRHAYAPRLAKPGQSLTTEPNGLGLTITLHPDANGIVRPSSADDVRAADELGLPIIREQE